MTNPARPFSRFAFVACSLMAAAVTVAAGVSESGAPSPVAPFKIPPGLPQGWYARISTSFGDIVARLLPEQAPQSVAHFAALAEGKLAWTDPFTGETRKDPYYDGTKVHLVEAAQRFEAGDRTGTGRGAPTYYVPPEGKGPVNFSRPGRLGMTRASLGRVSGVQFFATAASQPFLNGHHPCFGEVVSGREVIEAISTVKSFANGKPLDPPEIRNVRIFKVGEPPPLPDPVLYRPTPPEFGRKKPA